MKVGPESESRAYTMRHHHHHSDDGQDGDHFGGAGGGGNCVQNDARPGHYEPQVAPPSPPAQSDCCHEPTLASNIDDNLLVFVTSHTHPTDTRLQSATKLSRCQIVKQNIITPKATRNSRGYNYNHHHHHQHDDQAISDIEETATTKTLTNLDAGNNIQILHTQTTELILSKPIGQVDDKTINKWHCDHQFNNNTQSKKDHNNTCSNYLITQQSQQPNSNSNTIKEEPIATLNDDMATALTTAIDLTQVHQQQNEPDQKAINEQLQTLTDFNSDTNSTHDDDDDDDDRDDHNRLRHRHNDHHSSIHNNRRSSFSAIEHQHQTKLTETQLMHLSNLIKIIRNGNFNEFLELLEQRGFKSNLLNVFVDGQTALHYSLIYGRSLAWCKQLVLNGANPNLANRAGWHPIHLAAFSGSRETMRYLIDCIAN